MRGYFLRAAVISLAAFLLAGAWDGAHAADPATYATLVAELKASVDNPAGAPRYFNFKAIRDAYAISPDYDPYGTLVELHRVEMLRAYQHRDLKVALSEADKVLDQNYTDIGANVIADLAYSDLKDQVHARFHRMLAREFLLSIFRSGDGNSPATAYQIVSVPEEYAVLNARQVVFEKQTYQTSNGQFFDKLVGFDPLHNRHVSIYFNVDRMMEWANQMFSPQFRHLQPHGGPPDAALAAATSMLSGQP